MLSDGSIFTQMTTRKQGVDFDRPRIRSGGELGMKKKQCWAGTKTIVRYTYLKET
jgi:hypothetical protein